MLRSHLIAACICPVLVAPPTILAVSHHARRIVAHQMHAAAERLAPAPTPCVVADNEASAYVPVMPTPIPTPTPISIAPYTFSTPTTASREYWIRHYDAPTVPEPATWVTMSIGFGAVGISARVRRVARSKELQ